MYKGDKDLDRQPVMPCNSTVHESAWHELASNWSAIAKLHAMMNFLLVGWLCLYLPVNGLLLAFLGWFSAVFVLIFAVGFAAARLEGACRLGVLFFRRPNRFISRLLVIAGFGYAVAWVGMLTMVFAFGDERKLIAVTLIGLLLGFVAAHFSVAFGALARLVFGMQMLALVFCWLDRDYTYAFGLCIGLLTMLWISIYGERRYFLKYRMRRRQWRMLRVLHRRNLRLLHIDGSKDRLLAMTSHDLRQPMHALCLMVGSLRFDPGATEVREKVESINDVVDALARSLEMLMTLARLDAGTYDTKIEPLVLDRLFASLHNEFEPLAAEKRLKFECESNSLGILTDATLLRGMLANFVANAIRYTHQGTVSVVARLMGDLGNVRIEITDTGDGIPTDRIPDIFEAFVRLGNAEASPDGLGLGLAITRRSAELLNVPIHVQSEVGKGTTFSLDLPHCSNPLPTPSFSVGSLTRLRGLRVVIVDNDRFVLSSMALTMEGWGCNVISAGGMIELEAKLEMMPSPVDIIITDYHLGAGSTGIDLIRRLRRRYGQCIAALLLTGDLGIHLGEEAAAFNLVIAYKPLSPNRLADLVGKSTSVRHSHPRCEDGGPR